MYQVLRTPCIIHTVILRMPRQQRAMLSCVQLTGGFAVDLSNDGWIEDVQKFTNFAPFITGTH